MRYRSFALAAAGISAGLAAFETVRLLLTHAQSPGHTVLNVVIGGVAFVVINALAAVTLALPRRSGFGFGAVAGVGSVAHGVIVRAGGAWAGVAYMLAGLAVFACVAKSLAYFRALPSPSPSAPRITVPARVPARA